MTTLLMRLKLIFLVLAFGCSTKQDFKYDKNYKTSPEFNKILIANYNYKKLKLNKFKSSERHLDCRPVESTFLS